MAGPINPVELSWDAPQTNADGTNLTDLKEYHVLIGPTNTGPWTQVEVVPAASLDPALGERIFTNVSDWGPLAKGQYYATIRAVDTAGNLSVMATSVPFVLGDVVAPSPPSGLLFD